MLSILVNFNLGHSITQLKMSVNRPRDIAERVELDDNLFEVQILN